MSNFSQGQGQSRRWFRLRRIDPEIAEKGRFWMETTYVVTHKGTQCLFR
jgi:hypothetical protein